MTRTPSAQGDGDPGVSAPDSLVVEVNRMFRRNPYVWFTQHDVAMVAGVGGWRTRVNEAERIFGLKLEKRQRVQMTTDGRRLRISERRFVPEQAA